MTGTRLPIERPEMCASKSTDKRGWMQNVWIQDAMLIATNGMVVFRTPIEGTAGISGIPLTTEFLKLARGNYDPDQKGKKNKVPYDLEVNKSKAISGDYDYHIDKKVKPGLNLNDLFKGVPTPAGKGNVTVQLNAAQLYNIAQAFGSKNGPTVTLTFDPKSPDGKMFVQPATPLKTSKGTAAVMIAKADQQPGYEEAKADAKPKDMRKKRGKKKTGLKAVK